MRLHPKATIVAAPAPANRENIGARAWFSCGLLMALTLQAADHTESYFGDAQAQRGNVLYERHCSVCHGARLEGGSAVPLRAPVFRARWSHETHSLDDLLYIVRTQMPYGEPNKLSKLEYLDIVAFILKVNDYPGGGADLPLDSNILSLKKLKR